ncbi:PGLT1-like protein [Mya arenaria]|uniref:PGLT1-like protein n=1 Tax=Mya arenaria TaxID=6604 RepID=A0ABY7FX08_MYAAR|nr:PGLT1-like protein [Mya arenaria]
MYGVSRPQLHNLDQDGWQALLHKELEPRGVGFPFPSCNSLAEEKCSANDPESCKDGDEGGHAKSKYAKGTNTKWNNYLEKIEQAVLEYTDCNQDDCSCHASMIDTDLGVWEDSGISRENLESAKQRGTHYQIINHKLYREKDCMFPARCSGVEHFILEIIKKLPDMEFILNTRDWPQSSRYQDPLPVFSFSKVAKQNWDIMYPAWTFWEGGPAVWPIYPTGLGRWDEQREIIPSAERDPLIRLSRAEPDLVDAEYTKNQAWKSLEHLFLCDSVVFHVGEDWLEFFYPAMKPWVHYIPVRQDLNDVKELLQFAKENDEVVHDIAKRGRQFIWDHLRMEDVSCYWLKLLKRYARLQDFKPTQNKTFMQIMAR